MFKIIAPEKNYKGVTSGIFFNNGNAIAELDVFSKDWFLSKGYILEEIKDIPTANSGISVKSQETIKNTGNQEKPLTKEKLLEKAKILGIEVKKRITNTELEKLIAEKETEIKADELESSDAENLKTGTSNDDPEAGE